MTGELRTDLPSSLSGNGAKDEATPELEAAERNLDQAAEMFIQTVNEFLAAGGSPQVVMEKFQKLALQAQG
jgi:hypothetical protein